MKEAGQNYKDNKQISGCHGKVGGQSIDWENTGYFFSSVKLYYGGYRVLCICQIHRNL